MKFEDKIGKFPLHKLLLRAPVHSLRGVTGYGRGLQNSPAVCSQWGGFPDCCFPSSNTFYSSFCIR